LILISSTATDSTTDIVIDWLHYFKADFIRINDDEPAEIEFLSISTKRVEFQLNFKGKRITDKNLTTYWYRRGMLNLKLNLNKANLFGLELYLHEEERKVTSFLDQYFSTFGVGCFADNHINKLDVLYTAKSVGLLIPNSYLSNNPKVYAGMQNSQGLITKSLVDGYPYFKGHKFTFYTNRLTHLEKIIPLQKCYPFFVQEEIYKSVEVRVFYWLGECYSAIIHSQNNDDTKVDMRLDFEKMARWEPIELPKKLVQKIKKLMGRLKLKSGSLDFAITPQGKYIFFEVNPVGQFGYLSKYCNYNIEKRIAHDLATGRVREVSA
jgi:ATP-GRASP peptide maturase of grasp-with-spasm system